MQLTLCLMLNYDFKDNMAINKFNVQFLIVTFSNSKIN